MDSATTTGSPVTGAAVDPNIGPPEDLAVVREQTRETLELVRALVGLLLNKPEKTGPTLEDLLAALVAQQRDMLVLLRQVALDQSAILDRLPPPPDYTGASPANGHGDNGSRRP